MKKLFYPALALLMIIAFSCTKTKEDIKVELLNNFMPTTTNSFWTYTDYPQGSVYSQLVTSIDSTFGGKKYRGVANTQAGISWYRKDAGAYYNLLINGNQQIEFLYLKDNVPVGAHWDVSYTNNGNPTKLHYTIAEFDVPKTVYGFIYPHCINVNMKTYIDFGDGDTLMGNSTNLYANGVGLVYVERSYDSKTYLNSYKIN
ncbi:MAG: hypothetical protein WCO63_09040 [Bacteroidota bacterium]